MTAAGIYIHVPFCLRKCPYCDFYSVKYDADTAEKYVGAVCRNIAAFGGRNVTADTVYFGGGTPSLLTPAQISRILDTVYKNINLISPEITLEANPSSLTAEKLRGYRSAGVDRLSVGFQSADDSQLRFLGRLHDTARAENAVLEAHAAGFDNISCDLILGSEGQNVGSLDRTIDRLLGLPISHISAYMLKIEQGTPFDCDDIRRRAADEETLCQLYEYMCGRLSAAGFEHYEISNFALADRRSRHNMKYWRVEPYIGIGAAAHSDFGGVRYFCPPDVSAFVAAETQPVEIEDAAPDRFEECVMLGARISDGFELSRLTALGGEQRTRDLLKRAAPLAAAGFLAVTSERIALTERAFLLSNEIISRLL